MVLNSCFGGSSLTLWSDTKSSSLTVSLRVSGFAMLDLVLLILATFAPTGSHLIRQNTVHPMQCRETGLQRSHVGAGNAQGPSRPGLTIADSVEGTGRVLKIIDVSRRWTTIV